MELPELRRLLLLESSRGEPIGSAYGATREILLRLGSERDPVVETITSTDDLVRDTLLALYDDGLVSFYRAPWKGGDEAEFPTLTRREVEAELARSDVVDPRENVLFFKATEAGEAVLDSSPPPCA